MVDIYYVSITGNVKRFVKKTGLNGININEIKSVSKKGIFITPTIGVGEIPRESLEFVTKNHKKIIGLVGSGNKNWGSAYCAAVDKLSERFNIPVLMKFELQGTNETVNKFKEIYNEISKAG